MNVTYQCISSLIFLQLALALNVSRLRGQTNTLVGASTDPGDPLHKARIAHSNACEFIPALCVLMLCLERVGVGPSMGWLFRAVVVARFSHAFGIVLPARMDRPNLLRLIGATGSLLLGLIMAGYLFCHS
jgi:uncharacterized membrane protein YecN with MAPEG domain